MITIMFFTVQDGGLFREKKTYTGAVHKQQDIHDTDAFMIKVEKRTKVRDHQDSVCGK